MARKIDPLTKKPIVEITSDKGFVNSVVHLTPVIRTTGSFAHECFDRMKKSKKLAKLGKATLIGEVLPVFDVISVGYLLSLGPGAAFVAEEAITAAPVLFSPAGIAALAVFGIAGAAAIVDGKKFKKYEAEVVSEDEIIYRLKSLPKVY